MFEELSKRGIHINEEAIIGVDIPNGEAPHELWEILRVILKNVPQGVYLTLDITHGFRSFPFIFFTAALFLEALREVEIKAVYYGMLTEGQGPMVDLSLILDMVEWFYATRTFKETGQAYHLNKMLAELEVAPEGLMGHARAPYGQIKTLRDTLEDFTYCYVQALPLELGLISAQVLHNLCQAEFNNILREQIPVPDELGGVIHDFITPFALPLPGRRNKKNKKEIPLNEKELKRQALIIDAYLEQGYLNYAIGMIREWMVSVALMHNDVITETENGFRNLWLNYDRDRKPVEDRLNNLDNIMKSRKKDLLTEEQKWLGTKWQVLRDKRNQLAHHGYREDYSLQGKEDVEEIFAHWEELKGKRDDSSWWKLEYYQGAVGQNRTVAEDFFDGNLGTARNREGKNLLVSPLGLSKGLLFSALKHVQPQQLIVITSQKSVGNIQEIIAEAGWEGDLVVKTMKEPFVGFDEAEGLVSEIQPLIRDSGEVIVNITGGTTAMQYVAQEVADDAAREQLSLKIMALVDRRPPEEQRANPYVLGEVVWLKNKSNTD